MKYIELSRGFKAIVDDEDYEMLIKYKWYVAITPRINYARTFLKDELGKWHGVLIHRMILGLVINNSVCVDHINHDGLDNRKINLRPASYSQNGMNRRKNQIAISKYKGVCKTSDNKAWQAQIRKEGKLFYLGRFKTEDEAANIYKKTAGELFGDYSYAI